MPGLTKCLKRLGLAKHEAAILRGEVKDLLADGYSAHDAAVRAVKGYIQELEAERADILKQVGEEPKPATQAETSPQSDLFAEQTTKAVEAMTDAVKALKEEVSTIKSEAKDNAVKDSETTRSDGSVQHAAGTEEGKGPLPANQSGEGISQSGQGKEVQEVAPAEKPAAKAEAATGKIDDVGENAVEAVRSTEKGTALFSRRTESLRQHGIPKSASAPISSFVNAEPLKAHADYKASKSGDYEAAARLVRYLVKPENLEAARKQFGADAIFAPVVGIEASGQNQIPRMLAEYYAAETGAKTSVGEIIQANKAHHTGAGPMERMIARPLFDGPVEHGGKYVLVDDVTTMGGTLAEMANHIQANGGHVVGVVTLVNAGRSATLPPSKQQTSEIERRYGHEIRTLFGIEPSSLTSNEATYILGFRNSDDLRNRVTAAEGQRSERLRAKGIQEKDVTKPGILHSRTTETRPQGGFSASGVSLRDAEATKARVSKSYKNLPPIHLHERVAQAPKNLLKQIDNKKARGDVEGAFHEGEIHLFLENLRDEARMEFVLFEHEVFHYGARGVFGKGLDAIFSHIYLTNANVRTAADALRKSHKLDSNVEAVDEVLANMPSSELPKLKGWDRVVSYLRNWFASHGFQKLADRLNAALAAKHGEQGAADLFAAEVITKARAWAKSGKQTAATSLYMGDTRLSGDAQFSRKTGETTEPSNSKTGDYGKPMGELLNIFDRNQIVQLYSDALPELRTYKQSQDQMVADRNKMLFEADELLDKLRNLPKAERDRFASIAHEATLEGVDPSVAYREPPTIEDLRRLADGLSKRKAESGLTDKQEKLLAFTQDRIKAKPGIHARLKLEFDNLSKTGQQVFRDLRDAYIRNADNLFKALEGRIDRMSVADTAKRAAVLELRAEFDRLKKGIYFPLSRFGNHVVIGEKVVNGMPSRAVEYHDSKSRADKAAEKLRAEGAEVKQTTRKAFSKELAANKAVSAIVDKVKSLAEQRNGELLDVNKQELELLLDDVNQVLIQMLPDQSFRRHFAHRKNVPGYSSDFIRAYADSMWKSSNHVANLRYGDQVTQSIVDMQKRIDGLRNADVSALQDVVNHLLKREEKLREPISPVAAAVGQVGFLSALASVSNFFVNLTQTPVLTFPFLGARYGYAKTTLQLTNAMAKQVTAFRGAKSLYQLEQLTDMRNTLKGNELVIFQRLHDTGKIEVTQAHDLIDAANKEAELDYHSPWNMAVRVGALPQHLSEVINRQVTALAAIRLEMNKSGDAEKAFNSAVEAIDQTHYDYEKTNRAMIMQGNTQRVVFMFKQYAQKTAFLWARTAQLALSGADAETRKIARKQLAGMVGMQFLISGALGLPIFTEAAVVGSGVVGFKLAGKKGAYAGVIGAIVIAAIASVLDDDEDDFDSEVRRWLAENVGKKWGEVIAHGALRLAGVDIASRVGADELLLRKPDKSLEGKDAYWNWVSSIGGYAFGQGANVAVGLSLIDEGHVERGLEKIIPVKQVRDVMAATRFGTEGIKSMGGDNLLSQASPPKPTDYEIVMKGVGFNPARAAEAYEANSAIKNAEKILNGQRKKLLDRWSDAVNAGDEKGKEEVIKDIDGFNEKHPTHRIRGQDRMSSVRSRRNADKRTEGGVELSKKHAPLREKGSFANTD